MVAVHAELLSLMESRSAWELTQRTSHLSQGMGFEYFIYGARLCDAQGHAVDTVLNGYPINWRRAYEEQQYVQRDPTVRHALSSHLPLLWTGELFASQGAADLHEHARQFGLCGGLTIPIHAADRRVGLLSLATEDAKFGGDGAVQVLGQARLLADYLHEAAQRLLAPRTPLTKGLLSARECECLHWAAAGKTSWEIGRILSLSERTVNFHIGNAMRKLEVTTRGQALAKALALQLIRP
jgi:DNA-binding CsgD family transcriptional regulator